MPNLVIPSNVPLADMRGEHLENLVYWLLDDLGAKDLVWRAGGDSVTSADGGRDLEATFHIPRPEGETRMERWWVEVRGRRGTLESDSVKAAVVGVQAHSNVDLFLIVTNTRFSNPTRDWIAEWQLTHPRPEIRLWDKHALERMLAKHPSVAYRVSPDALSDQGMLEALTLRFVNQMYFPSNSDLKRLWDDRNSLEWNESNLLVVLAGELANGDIRAHPWSATWPALLAPSLIHLLVNFPFFAARAQRFGVSDSILDKLREHLVVSALVQFGATGTEKLIDKAISDFPEATRQIAQDLIIKPMFTYLGWRLLDICKRDCGRVVDIDDDNDEFEAYWDGFVPLEAIAGPRNYGNDKRIIIQDLTVPCKVGFDLGSERGCPLLEFAGMSNADLLETAQRVSAFRLKEATI